MAIKGIIALALILLAGYGLIEARHLIAGPSIEIEVPIDYTTSADGFITVSGVARNTEALLLDGSPLPIDQAGRFSETIVLPKGGGILSLIARDRFGRSVTETRTVYVP